MDRETELVEVVSRFLQVHNAWANSPTENLTEEYENAAEIMLRGFESGDVPERCRALLGRVDYARSQWQSFQAYRSKLHPKPRDAWWSAVEALLKEVEGLAVDEERYIEPVYLLLEQKVGVNQIAHHIYGHNGVGPFLKNGVPQPQLIYKEGREPGSVLGADWVHPAEAERRAARKAYLAQRLEQTRALAKAHADAPETIDELLEQGVGVKQIAQMKGVSMNDVIQIAKKLGKDVGPVPAPIVVPTPESLAGPIADDDLDFDDDDDDEDEDDDDSTDESSDVTASIDPVDARILELSAAGKSAAEIGKELNVTTQKAAAVVRAHKGRQPAPVPAPVTDPAATL
jgi:hypothetical protein